MEQTFPLQLDKTCCTSCGTCQEKCTFQAIDFAGEYPEINAVCCRLCGACAKACPTQALTLTPKNKRLKDAGSDVWVLAEASETGIEEVTRQLIGEARRLADVLGQKVSVVLMGHDVALHACELIAHGADSVYLAEHPLFEQHIEEHYSEVLAMLARQHRPNTLLVGATPWGRGIAARVAALLHTGLTADCTQLSIDPVSQQLLQRRPAFGGNLLATIETPYTRPQMASVRPNVMNALPADLSRQGKTIVCDLSTFHFDQRVKQLATFAKEASCQSLNHAEVIVSVGRGVKDPKTLELVYQLADRLNGMVSGSRAAVEAGLIRAEYQVGQTGHTVAPKLYIACGISGQIQHTAAITAADTIIAINIDPQAPIFEYAHYGLVADLQTALPQLLSQL